MALQRTIKTEVSIRGIGLHSGKNASVTFKPASPGLGIVFIRTDLPGAPQILAHFSNVSNTQLATTLGTGKATVSTVEHLLAAIQGLGIDNIKVEVDGPEIPIMDGSSLFFCEALHRAGTETQFQPRRHVNLKKKIELRLQEKWAVVTPASRLEIHGSIEWDHPAIGYQEFFYQEGRNFTSELAGARTFGFLKDVEILKAKGLARGGSIDNAVVLDHALVLNPGGLRFPDEFVRHKILDALGDFKLAGLPIHAHFRLHRAGHDLHNQLLAEIFKSPDHFEIIEEVNEESRTNVLHPTFIPVYAAASN